MNTFNLGFVFGAGEAMVTIVCASEQPIDRLEVQQVAMKYFTENMASAAPSGRVIQRVVDGIRKECGCHAVTVSADCVCMVYRKQQ